MSWEQYVALPFLILGWDFVKSFYNQWRRSGQVRLEYDSGDNDPHTYPVSPDEFIDLTQDLVDLGLVPTDGELSKDGTLSLHIRKLNA